LNGMTGAIDPIRPIRLVRRERRQAPPKSAEPPVVNVTVNVGAEAPQRPRSPANPAANLEAHLIAQGARARGLRGGPKVLQTARAVYLETEWSGPNDRRVRTGRITKTQA
jgi:hypothetical protein